MRASIDTVLPNLNKKANWITITERKWADYSSAITGLRNLSWNINIYSPFFPQFTCASHVSSLSQSTIYGTKTLTTQPIYCCDILTCTCMYKYKSHSSHFLSRFGFMFFYHHLYCSCMSWHRRNFYWAYSLFHDHTSRLSFPVEQSMLPSKGKHGESVFLKIKSSKTISLFYLLLTKEDSIQETHSVQSSCVGTKHYSGARFFSTSMTISNTLTKVHIFSKIIQYRHVLICYLLSCITNF